MEPEAFLTFLNHNLTKGSFFSDILARSPGIRLANDDGILRAALFGTSKFLSMEDVMLAEFFDSPSSIRKLRDGSQGHLPEGFAQELCQAG
jgi:hypothetical protein